MAFPIVPSDANIMSLDDVLSRLKEHETVVGIVLMGSTETGQLTPTSDYDVGLVLTELPVPARLITTWINGHFAEVYCMTVGAVERTVAEPSAWPANTSEEESIVRWLRSEAIVHDRTGLMRKAAAIVHRTPPALPGELARYHAWWGINYNVVHMRRYLASDDPRSRPAARLRFLYSLMDVVGHYFTVRQIPWYGEKAAIQYFMKHDPHFLDLLEQALGETDLERKRQIYEELAQVTLAPVGGLWPADATSVWLGWGYGSASEPVEDPVAEQARGTLAFWHHLVSGNESRLSESPRQPPSPTGPLA